MAAARNASSTDNPKNGRDHSRLSFAKISDTLSVPNLLALQLESFDWLVGNEEWKERVGEVVHEDGTSRAQVLERQSWLVGEVDWEELYPAPGTPRPLFGTTWA